MACIFTIGHSNHEFATLKDLLTTYEIDVVADVRSSPYSRLNPQFGREPLKSQLQRHGISYVFLGGELGARPKDPSCYIQGKVQYRVLAQTEFFRSGLNTVIDLATSSRVALLCAEKEPLYCHRSLLIARELEALRIPVSHILADGKSESHSQTVGRLLELLGVFSDELFRTRDELIDEAYALQEDRIAYVEVVAGEGVSA